ncbi:MAG: DUF362 domain-containing protein [Deltaproteobacteria bacterium]|nr:MAG: DUF362 domain-containing protein [Deltaproteobacteria bacterium]
MKKSKRVITRRDFIRTGSYAAVGGLMGLPLLSYAADKKTQKSRAVLIRDNKILEPGGSLRKSNLEEIFDEAVTTLLDAEDPASAWRQLVQPTDIVGVKSNVWGPLPTPSHLEATIKKRLMAVGVKEQNIAIDDRGVRSNSVFKKSTALINVRPMRTHHWSGLGTLLKNYIMFVSTPWMYHGNACERLGAIWNKSHIKGKTRLNILVMLTPLFHGVGPHHYSRRYTWPYGGLIVSTDPVAADATGARIIQAKRHEFFGKDRPISPPPRHIEAADNKFDLGNSHPDRIDLIKLGWQKDILI